MQESHLRSKQLMYRRRIALLALLLSVVWIAMVYRYESTTFRQRADSYIEQEQKRSNALAQGVAADLQRSLRMMQGIPYVLANQAQLHQALRSSASNSIVDELPQERKQRLRKQNIQEPWRSINVALSEARDRLNFDLAYILDRHGDCLAASDHQLPDSLIGNNYRERHYFKAALDGESGYQFAFGKTSRTPGFYFSAPIFEGDSIVAVMVAKIDIARLAQDIDLTGVFLIDENGVIVLAQDKHQEMKAMQTSQVFAMTVEKRKSLYGREDFPALEIRAWSTPGFSAVKQFGDNPAPLIIGRLKLDEKPLEVMSVLSASNLLVLDSEKKRLILLASVAGVGVIVILMLVMLYFLETAATQNLLQLQRKRLNEAQKLAGMGSWSVELESRSLLCSDSARWLLSIENTTETVTLEALYCAIHREDREQVERALEEAMAQGKPFHMGFRLVRANGELHYVVGDAMPAFDVETAEKSFEGTIRDISEYQSLLNALETSESHLRKVIDACLIGIVQGNRLGMLTGANQAFVQMSAYAQDEFDGQRLSWKALTPEHYHAAEEQIYEQLEAGNISATLEKEIICADGRQLPVQVGIALVDRNERDWVAFVLDLSERNRVQRLQSEFISIVSHELRTPLTSIRGSLSILENGLVGALPEKALQMISVAHRNSKRLSSLVNDILDLEKLSTGAMRCEMRALDLVQLLPQVLEANASYAQSCGVRLVLEYQAKQALMWGDEERLQQVFSNLLSNAAKFSPSGETVLLRLQEQDHRWQIHVIDRGPGIPESFQHLMFASFAQADNSDTRQKQGSGLGLKITKSLVELMEGEITFTTSARGTDFWVSFEKYEEPKASTLQS